MQITLIFHSESLRAALRDHRAFLREHWWPLAWFLIVAALHCFALHAINRAIVLRRRRRHRAVGRVDPCFSVDRRRRCRVAARQLGLRLQTLLDSRANRAHPDDVQVLICKLVDCRSSFEHRTSTSTSNIEASASASVRCRCSAGGATDERLSIPSRCVTPSAALARTVPRGISLSLPPGAFHLLIGEPGSGRNALLRVLGLLDPPAAARCSSRVARRRPCRARARRAAQPALRISLRRAVSCCTHFPSSKTSRCRFSKSRTSTRSRRANVPNGCSISSASTVPRSSRASGLTPFQQHAVALARALANEPALITAESLETALPPEEIARFRRAAAPGLRALRRDGHRFRLRRTFQANPRTGSSRSTRPESSRDSLPTP